MTCALFIPRHEKKFFKCKNIGVRTTPDKLYILFKETEFQYTKSRHKKYLKFVIFIKRFNV